MSTINTLNIKTINTALTKAKIKPTDVLSLNFDTSLVTDETLMSSFNLLTNKVEVSYQDAKLSIVPMGFDVINDDLSSLELIKSTFTELVGVTVQATPKATKGIKVTKTAQGVASTPTVAPTPLPTAPAPTVEAETVVADGYTRPASKGKIHERVGVTERQWRKYSKEEKEGIKGLIGQGRYVLDKVDPNTLPEEIYNIEKFNIVIGKHAEEKAATAPIVEETIVPSPIPATEISDAPHLTQGDMIGAPTVKPVATQSVDLSGIPGL